MSSVCGIIDLERGLVDFDTLKSMGRTMILRGKAQSGAYMNRGVGFQHNRMILSGGARERQPYTIIRGGRVYTVVFDGELYNLEYIAALLDMQGFGCSAEAVLESYIAFGYSCVEYLDGAFAFSVYDESRNEVFLARDGVGAKPLYYLKDGGRLAFASEIKGLLRYMKEGAEIEMGALRELISAPIGMVRGCDIYKGLNELPEGSFAVHSRLGTQIFEYKKRVKDVGFERWRSSDKILVPSQETKYGDVNTTLHEILVAFDHPCFDEYMLGYLNAIKENSGLGNIVIEDRTLLIDVRYACERADRLGMMNGVMVRIIPPRDEKRIKGSALSRIEKKLCGMAGELCRSENSRASKIFGKDTKETIEREKCIERRLRAYGMIIQTEIWLSSYPVVADI